MKITKVKPYNKKMSVTSSYKSSIQDFTPDLYTIGENSPRRPYRSQPNPSNVHWGQLKLFATEVLFMTDYVRNTGCRTVIYVGAGPGHHLKVLAKMFPGYVFHLYDDHFDRSLESISNIRVHLKYFDEEECDLYRDVKTCFISDIRNLSFKKAGGWSADEELKVLDDLKMQRVWVERLRPMYSMLKFRTPFFDPSVVSTLGRDYIEYFRGEILRQCFAGPSSIETRLIVGEQDIDNITRYGLKEYEERLFFHNTTTRQVVYRFPYTKYYDTVKLNRGHLDHRYDSAYLMTVLDRYLTLCTDKNEPQRYLASVNLLKKIE